MTTYFSGEGGAVPGVEGQKSNENTFLIDINNTNRVRLEIPGYKTTFQTNLGDKFYEHNELLYIQTQNGEIISGHNYSWENSLITSVFHQFKTFFGSAVQARQIDTHSQLLGI